MILVELTAAVDEYGSLRTFYLSDIGWVTSPTDAPANTEFLGRLKDPGSITLWAFSEGKTTGSSKLQPGEIKVINNDGALDDWINYSFDGQPVTIRAGEGGAYPGDFDTVFTGTIVSVEATVSAITVNVADKAAVLDKPVLTTQYAGTNSGPTGLEGLPGDLKGKVKPRIYGKVFNVSPFLVNASKLTFQISDRAVDAISAVYDRGAALTAGTDYATSALLTAATPTAGTFDTCVAEALFRLGSSPTGQITVDAVAGGSDSLRTIAEILKQLALDAGLTDASILASDVGELNALAPYVVGLYLSDDTSFRSAMDQIAQSAGCWWAFDLSGALRMGQLAAPGGTPEAEFIEEDVLTGFERLVADGSGVPVWRVNVRHTRLYTVQASDVAGSVSDDRRAEIAQEYRTVSAEDPSIKIQFAQARELTVDTLLTAEADAQTEADRLLAIHKVRRDLFNTPIPLEVFRQAPLDLMRPASQTHRRFGLSGGKTFSLLGLELDLAQSRITMKLWG